MHCRASLVQAYLTRYSTYCTRILLSVHQISSLAASRCISPHACGLLSSASGDYYRIGKWGPTRAPQFVKAQSERIAQHSIRHVHIPPAEARFGRIQATMCAADGHSFAMRCAHLSLTHVASAFAFDAMCASITDTWGVSFRVWCELALGTPCTKSSRHDRRAPQLVAEDRPQTCNLIINLLISVDGAYAGLEH